MQTKILTFISVSLVFILSSCSPKHSEIVVAEYGNNEITMNEFENAYIKNAGSIEQAKEDSLPKLESFLDLYTNFKMKLRDAKVRGYDKDSSLQNELMSYKKNIGVTFLLNRKIIEPGIKDLYEKRKSELRVSHIMFRTDTSDAEKRELAQSVLDSIKNGISFEAMARKYSEDAFSAKKGGDIYYITGGLLPESFETAAYSTNAGELYPEVVKTRFGYHLIRVTEKKDRIPEIRASHILISLRNPTGVVDTATSKAKIDSVLNMIENGADFAKLAMEYSDDPGSKEKGGDLGYFSRRMMVQEFDDAAFNLEVGEVSGVVKTQFGYHLIKVTDKRPTPSFEENKEDLIQLFKKNRYQVEYDSLISQLKSKYNFKVIDNTLDYISANSDSMYFGADSSLVEEIKGMELYSFTGFSQDAAEFFKDLGSDKSYAGKLINPAIIKKAIDEKSKEQLLENEALNLETTDSSYASLMDDYRNGLYIFKLQEDEVWNKVSADSTELQNYYEKNKEKYTWPDRVQYKSIMVNKDSVANLVYNELQDGVGFDSLIAKYSVKKSGSNVSELVDVNNSELARNANKLKNAGDFSEPFKFGGGLYIVQLVKKEDAGVKAFEEAKPEVAADYQEQKAKELENEYIQRLKNRYEPVYHYDELTKAFQEE